MRRRVAEIVALVQREIGPLDAQARAELARELTAMLAPQRGLFEEPRPGLALVPPPVARQNAPQAGSAPRYSEFSEWWALYPQGWKVGKGAAWAAWQKHRPPFEQAIRTLAAYRESEEWARVNREGERCIPHPATWLNQHRWDDEPTPRRATLAPATQRMVERTGGF